MTDPFRDDVGAYLVGSLRESEQGAFEDHLLGCASCRSEVRELGHLPGMLAMVPSEGASDPPPSVLGGLLAAVYRQRSRRRMWLAGVGIAAATLVGVTFASQFVAMPRTEQTTASATRVELRALTDAPVSASLDLVAVPWGTRMDLHCSYVADRYARPVEYALVVYDVGGGAEQVATWTALPGADVSVPAGTAMRLDQIGRVEMTAEGAVVLVGEV